MAKILVITSRFPFPLEKGDKLRVYNQIKYLSRQHEVYLVAINHVQPTTEQLDALRSFCVSISVFVIPVYKRLLNLITAFFKQAPFQVHYFFSRAVKKAIAEHLGKVKPDAIYSHLIRTSEYAKDATVRSKTLDYMDCFSKGFEFKIKATRNPVLKFVYSIEHKRLLAYERAIFESFDQHIIISDQDRQAIPLPQKNKIGIVSNGVDFDIFYPKESIKKYDLLFSGNMGYRPNSDAAYYAATEVLPGIMKKYPKIKMLIAGVNPPRRIRKLQSENIDVIEKFDHIRDAFLQSKINFVPVITSIGLQNKILQGLAMKIPTVTTMAGARGVNAAGTNVLLVGQTPAELATHIETLLEDEKEFCRMQEEGYEFVKQHFSWEIHNEKLADLLLK